MASSDNDGKHAGSLRMKETPVERAARKAAKRARKDKREKRRKRTQEGAVDIASDSSEQRYRSRTRHDGPSRYFEPSPEPVKASKTEDDDDSDAYVPPRPSANRPYVPYTFDDDDPESRLPAAAAHKPDLDDEAAFREKLFEAMRDDEGADQYTRAKRDNYEYALPDGFGTSGVYNDHYVDPDTGAVINRIIYKHAMTEDE